MESSLMFYDGSVGPGMVRVSFLFVLVLAAFVFLCVATALVFILFRNSRRKTGDAAEVRMLRELADSMGEMEERIDSLETLLTDRQRNADSPYQRGRHSV